MNKVLIVGQALELGRTEEVYGRGFSALGCKVQHFTWKEAAPSLVSRSLPDRVAWRLAWKLLAKSANQKLVEIANQFKPDLTLVISPLLFHPDSILALKQHGLVFVFFTDNPVDAHHTHSNSWVQRGFPLWDAAFIWSQELVERLVENGVKRAFFHPFCSDVEYHFPKRQANPIYDVAFIGNWDASRKREQYLKAIADYRLGLWGSSYWNTHCKEPTLKNLCQGMCSYQEIPEILGSAKMGLNILRPQNEEGHNIRTYEIPATGTLMLSERSRELMNLFAEDKEAVYFSSPNELRQKVEYLLQNHALIESIAQAGYKKALEDTIINRVKEILTIHETINQSHSNQYINVG
ncbi:glycosyltransferase [Chlorogloeopsis sp. ULAP01]|uniref:CgeB family protein n=1 Tax=Chlorogloeopsis sp. ULAP01 TaxID=3056483 RepID=UPI0025AA40DB|nr:glycosyltransferase [Chlorogloeopsis sp. ULAP01]MDM9379620.1 glycosyltransferase [Chlorogloeopsis sp. ULAP01]